MNAYGGADTDDHNSASSLSTQQANVSETNTSEAVFFP